MRVMSKRDVRLLQEAGIRDSIENFIKSNLRRAIPIAIIVAMVTSMYNISKREAEQKVREVKETTTISKPIQEVSKEEGGYGLETISLDDAMKEADPNFFETNNNRQVPLAIYPPKDRLQKPSFIPENIWERAEVVIPDMTISVYHPKKGQTDDRPYETADQSDIKKFIAKNNRFPRWAAVSRDLINHHVLKNLRGGDINFGDKIYIWNRRA